jgi:hypothetical protein
MRSASNLLRRVVIEDWPDDNPASDQHFSKRILDMRKQIELIKQSLPIAIAERTADRKIFQQSSALLAQSHDLQWVLVNVLMNAIMDLVDKGEEVDPAQFMETLSADVVEFFDSLV